MEEGITLNLFQRPGHARDPLVDGRFFSSVRQIRLLLYAHFSGHALGSVFVRHCSGSGAGELCGFQFHVDLLAEGGGDVH